MVIQVLDTSMESSVSHDNECCHMIFKNCMNTIKDKGNLSPAGE